MTDVGEEITGTGDEEIIDVGGAAERRRLEDIPSVLVKLAGKVYRAYLPKDAAWLYVLRSATAEDPAEAARMLFGFLDACFDEETRNELADRAYDTLDPLSFKGHLEPTLWALMDRFEPLVRDQLAGVGADTGQLDELRQATGGTGEAGGQGGQGPNRQQRRAAKKTTPTRTAARTAGRKALSGR